MAVVLYLQNFQKVIADEKSKLNEERPDLVKRYGRYIHRLTNRQATFGQIYRLVCDQLNRLDQGIQNYLLNMSSFLNEEDQVDDEEIAVAQNMSRLLQHDRHEIIMLNEQTKLIEIGQAARKKINVARKQIRLIPRLADTLISMPIDLVALISRYV